MNDQKTADAFATSWNNLPIEPTYTVDQFTEWMEPMTTDDFKDKEVLELGCGNGSLLFYASKNSPKKLTGVDLGASIESAKKLNPQNVEIVQHDLTTFKGDGYDLVYSIGVLHHLQKPEAGFDSVLANTKSGGKFHCWVYAHEGNWIIRTLLEPIRKVASKLPWWITKYFLATPLIVPFYFYAHALNILSKIVPKNILLLFPLFEYSLWICKRNFLFFRHVAFDQLVTPSTIYIDKQTIEKWLTKGSVQENGKYIIFRNGNSWKFGGIKK